MFQEHIFKFNLIINLKANTVINLLHGMDQLVNTLRNNRMEHTSSGEQILLEMLMLAVETVLSSTPQ